MVVAMRLLSFLFLVLFLVIPAQTAAQTYGSGELEYGGIRLQFSGQVSGGTCQLAAQNVMQCRLQAGASGAIQLIATRTPAGAVNIRAVSLPAGWPSFPVTSGWGTASTQYSFTIPSGSVGQRFELRFSAWTAGVVGELQLTCIIDALAPPTPTPPPAPTPTPSPVPSPALVPRIEVFPEELNFGDVTVGKQASAFFRIKNTGNAVLNVSRVSIGITPMPLGPFSLTWPQAVPFSLPPGGATAPFLVVFSPTGPGELKEKVIITSNDPQHPQVELPLTGRASKQPVVTEEEPSPEGETLPPPSAGEEKRCQECLLGVLTQNCQLIPGVTIFYGGTPYADRRAEEIGKLVAGEWGRRYHVICLQEVFSYAGENFRHKDQVAGVELQSSNWHKLDGDKELLLDGSAMQLLAKRPSGNTKLAQIAVVKEGDKYIITGPDSTASRRSTVDGGLMIVSHHPVLAASGFIFKYYPTWSLWPFWKIPFEAFANKGVLYARVQLDAARPECYIHIFNTHLAAGEENRDVRGKQLGELIAFIRECTLGDANPIIVCGDLNIIAGSEEYKNTLAASPEESGVLGIDSWQWRYEVTEEDHMSATWVDSRPLSEKGTPWGERNGLATEKEGGFQRLDYIFYENVVRLFGPGQSPLELRLQSVSREPARRRDERYEWGGYTVSDHLGVGAQFKVVPVGAGN